MDNEKKSRDLFARNLKRHMNRIGLSSAEVARRVGVGPSAVSDWMAGRGYPRLKNMNALVELFGITQTELVGNENQDKETISEEEQKVLDLFHQVPEEKREFVLSLIRAAINNL